VEKEKQISRVLITSFYIDNPVNLESHSKFMSPLGHKSRKEQNNGLRYQGPSLLPCEVLVLVFIVVEMETTRIKGPPLRVVPVPRERRNMDSLFYLITCICDHIHLLVVLSSPDDLPAIYALQTSPLLWSLISFLEEESRGSSLC